MPLHGQHCEVQVLLCGGEDPIVRPGAGYICYVAAVLSTRIYEDEVTWPDLGVNSRLILASKRGRPYAMSASLRV
jgi:hypothetical protein